MKFCLVRGSLQTGAQRPEGIKEEVRHVGLPDDVSEVHRSLGMAPDQLDLNPEIGPLLCVLCKKAVIDVSARGKDRLGPLVRTSSGVML